MNDFPVRCADVLLRRELIDAGLTDRDIARQVRSGLLVKLRYGAYLRAELGKDLDDIGLMRARSRAVLRTAHSASVLSHQCALGEHGLPLWGVPLTETHLVRTDGKHGRREAGIVHHRARLGEDEWKVSDGVPVVLPARAAMEIITSQKPEIGVVVVSGILHRNLATKAELREAAGRAARWPNSLNTRLVLARADARLTNVAEARTWHFFHAHHVPRPEPQVAVHDDAGNLLGIVDFLWEELGVFLEFDGRAKYQRHRRPGESLEDYLMREKRREEQICLVKGWICLRITWADLERPVVLAQRILKALASRRG